jgi:hypothetical protein
MKKWFKDLWNAQRKHKQEFVNSNKDNNQRYYKLETMTEKRIIELNSIKKVHTVLLVSSLQGLRMNLNLA